MRADVPFTPARGELLGVIRRDHGPHAATESGTEGARRFRTKFPREALQMNRLGDLVFERPFGTGLRAIHEGTEGAEIPGGQRGRRLRYEDERFIEELPEPRLEVSRRELVVRHGP